MNTKNNIFTSRFTYYCITLFIALFIAFSGCSSQQPTADATTTESVTLDQDSADLTTITDGILRCLAAKKYQWLQYYSDSELSGPKVARLILGDAAFDRNIVGWNSSLAKIEFFSNKKIARVSIPVSHEARVDKKFAARTTVFTFNFFFSDQQKRWLLFFKPEDKN